MESGGVGGSVLLGVGDVNAKIRAAEIGSASVLNSPTGVMFPGTDTAPPITRADLARRKTWGEWEAASAKFVKGPIAIRSTESGGFFSRICRISRCDGRLEASNREFDDCRSACAILIALDVIRGSGGGRSSNVCQISSGLE